MHSFEIDAAAADLDRILALVAAGAEAVISRDGRPIARIVPVQHPPRRLAGRDRGRLWIADDFDAPLPPEWLTGA